MPSWRALVCHPATPGRHVTGIQASAERISAARLVLRYALTGQLEHLRVPVAQPSRCGERLWEHTCFEAFIASMDTPAYCELNFAPSTAWTIYAFRRYRDGGTVEIDRGPALSVRRTPERLELTATLDLDTLPGVPTHAPLRLGLSAVVEDERGERSYWALRHRPGQPDFHHPEAFVLTLAPTAGDVAGAAR
ncbi:MAG: DOMON-like domain-containing protein [Burkholderiales bacterium]